MTLCEFAGFIKYTIIILSVSLQPLLTVSHLDLRN